MHTILESIHHNLRNLLRFSGRDEPRRFWPYTVIVLLALILLCTVLIAPAIRDTMMRMQAFALAHPDQATIVSAPGQYSITIRGNHPELMPDMGGLYRALVVPLLLAAFLLAAGVVRRLHDVGRTGLWALPPLLLLGTGLAVMSRLLASNFEDMSLFFAMFANNLLYLASLAWLLVLLAGNGSPAENRFGARSS